VAKAACRNTRQEGEKTDSARNMRVNPAMQASRHN